MRMWNRTRVRWMLPLSAGAVLAAIPLAGQEGTPIEEPTAPSCVCAGELRAAPWRAMTVARRARLGVVLGEPTDVGGRTGISLEDVPEGTPARRAGLRDGDVLVAIDGRELGLDPTSTLLSHMATVEPGDTVRVTFSRGDQERAASVVTEPATGFRAFGPDARLELRALTAPRAPGAPGSPKAHPDRRLDRVFRHRELSPAPLHPSLLRDRLKLAAVNAELGEYFGTERGVLVTEVDAESSLGLRTGDVILEIGGRRVDRPSDVRSILGSYRDGEDIPFRIVREKRTREVTGHRASSRPQGFRGG